MKDKKMSDKYKTVCVDNNINLPENIKEVPTIIDSDLVDILIGDKAFDYIANLQYFNFPSNNFNNWNNKIVPKPTILEDKKAYDNTAMENNTEHFNTSQQVNNMINIRRKQDINFKSKNNIH